MTRIKEQLKPFVFDYKSTISSVNHEIIKASLWIVQDGDMFFMYHRKRGEPLGKLKGVRDNRQVMFDIAASRLNKYLRRNGWMEHESNTQTDT